MIILNEKLKRFYCNYRGLIAIVLLLVGAFTVYVIAISSLNTVYEQSDWVNITAEENNKCNLCLQQFPQETCTFDSPSRGCQALQDYCWQNCSVIQRD